MSRYIRVLLATFMIVSPALLKAQCAMCKAVVESNAGTTDNVVEGVNTGIIYLMGIPYVLLFTIGFLWYRNRKKSTAVL